MKEVFNFIFTPIPLCHLRSEAICGSFGMIIQETVATSRSDMLYTMIFHFFLVWIEDEELGNREK